MTKTELIDMGLTSTKEFVKKLYLSGLSDDDKIDILLAVKIDFAVQIGIAMNEVY